VVFYGSSSVGNLIFARSEEYTRHGFSGQDLEPITSGAGRSESREAKNTALGGLKWGTLIALGKYKDAERILEDTLRCLDSVFTKSHRDVLSAQVTLANAFQFQGEYRKSEDLYRETWHAAHDALGDDHKTTLEAMTGLAWSLQHQGKYAEAEEIHRQTLAAQTLHLGAEHPDTLASMYGLAKTLEEKGNLEEAIRYYRQGADNGHEESRAALKRLNVDWDP